MKHKGGFRRVSLRVVTFCSKPNAMYAGRSACKSLLLSRMLYLGELEDEKPAAASCSELPTFCGSIT
jgi:hypothetical protein